MEDKATPLPWRNVGKNSFTGDYKIESDNIISSVGIIYKRKDADSIIKSVNAHDDLVEALKEVLGAIEFSGWNIDDSRWTKPIYEAKELLSRLEKS